MSEFERQLLARIQFLAEKGLWHGELPDPRVSA